MYWESASHSRVSPVFNRADVTRKCDAVSQYIFVTLNGSARRNHLGERRHRREGVPDALPDHSASARGEAASTLPWPSSTWAKRASSVDVTSFRPRRWRARPRGELLRAALQDRRSLPRR